MTRQFTKSKNEYETQLYRWRHEYLYRAKNFQEETAKNHLNSLNKFFVFWKAESVDEIEKHHEDPPEFEPLDFVEYKYQSTHHDSTASPDYTAEEICELDRRKIEDILFVGDERFGLINAEECIEYEKSHKDRQTVVNYFEDKKSAKPRLNYVEVTEEDIKEVDREDIYEYMIYLRDHEEVKQGTARKHRTSLKHFFRWASFEDYADIREENLNFEGKIKDVLTGFNQSHGYDGGKVLDYKDCVKLVGEYTDVKKRAIILTFLKTGIRRNELVNIKVEDVYLEDHFIHIRERKGGKKADVIFDDECAKYLKLYLQSKEYNSEDDYLFTHGKGKQYGTNTVTKMVKNWGDSVGLDMRGPHDFRHTFSNHYSGRVADTESGQEVYKKIQMSHQLSTSEEYRAKRNKPGEGPTKERYEDYKRAVPNYLSY